MTGAYPSGLATEEQDLDEFKDYPNPDHGDHSSHYESHELTSFLQLTVKSQRGCSLTGCPRHRTDYSIGVIAEQLRFSRTRDFTRLTKKGIALIISLTLLFISRKNNSRGWYYA
jgi:hypothetical protein